MSGNDDGVAGRTVAPLSRRIRFRDIPHPRVTRDDEKGRFLKTELIREFGFGYAPKPASATFRLVCARRFC